MGRFRGGRGEVGPHSRRLQAEAGAVIPSDETAQVRAARFRRRDHPTLHQKAVPGVPRDLANSIDENGSLVTVPPVDWIVCFVPGLQSQWWHRFVLSKHKHVYAMRPTSTGSWLLVEPWGTRMMVTILQIGRAHV